MNSIKKAFTLLYFAIPYLFHLPFMRRGAKDPYHKTYAEFTKKVNQIENDSVLEIGSRNVSGNIRKNQISHAKKYVGFDVLDGENVDVLGDAHELSSSLPHAHFDAVFPSLLLSICLCSGRLFWK